MEEGKGVGGTESSSSGGLGHREHQGMCEGEETEVSPRGGLSQEPWEIPDTCAWWDGTVRSAL